MAMKRPLIIWGASGHARVLREFSDATGYELIAVFDNAAVSPPFPDVPLHVGKEGFARWLKVGDRAGTAAMVAIGGDRGRDRLAMQTFLREQGMVIAHAIHPSCYVATTARLGSGCQVLAQSVVGADARLGDGCIINTRASVDHECVLGDGVHVAPGATLTGCITVGDCSMIGAGAVVLPRVRIGANAVIGAGAIVTKDVPDNAVIVGNPGRVMGYRQA